MSVKLVTGQLPTSEEEIGQDLSIQRSLLGSRLTSTVLKAEISEECEKQELPSTYTCDSDQQMITVWGSHVMNIPYTSYFICALLFITNCVLCYTVKRKQIVTNTQSLAAYHFFLIYSLGQNILLVVYVYYISRRKHVEEVDLTGVSISFGIPNSAKIYCIKLFFGILCLASANIISMCIIGPVFPLYIKDERLLESIRHHDNIWVMYFLAGAPLVLCLIWFQRVLQWEAIA